MTIAIDLGNDLISEAIYQLLITNGYDDVVVSSGSLTNDVVPHVFLVDVTTVRHAPLSRYPRAKVLLIDTGIEPEKLCATFLPSRIHGILSPHAELSLLKKALTAVNQGQLWIDDGSVKALLRDTGAISKKGRISHITGREQEVIEHVRKGLSNREIARSLGLSQYTVRTHLNKIFNKLNIAGRSTLMTQFVHVHDVQ